MQGLDTMLLSKLSQKTTMPTSKKFMKSVLLDFPYIPPETSFRDFCMLTKLSISDSKILFRRDTLQVEIKITKSACQVKSSND